MAPGGLALDIGLGAGRGPVHAAGEVLEHAAADVAGEGAPEAGDPAGEEHPGLGVQRDAGA